MPKPSTKTKHQNEHQNQTSSTPRQRGAFLLSPTPAVDLRSAHLAVGTQAFPSRSIPPAGEKAFPLRGRWHGVAVTDEVLPPSLREVSALADGGSSTKTPPVSLSLDSPLNEGGHIRLLLEEKLSSAKRMTDEVANARTWRWAQKPPSTREVARVCVTEGVQENSPPAGSPCCRVGRGLAPAKPSP